VAGTAAGGSKETGERGPAALAALLGLIAPKTGAACGPDRAGAERGPAARAADGVNVPVDAGFPVGLGIGLPEVTMRSAGYEFAAQAIGKATKIMTPEQDSPPLAKIPLGYARN
jgi:hypothetical protein